MSQALQPVRGTHDLMAADYARHEAVILAAQRVAMLYGYARIDTPMFEFSEVFHRAVGDSSDIVSKETYSFTDRGGESLTLRPEFTASVVRALISNKLTQELPFKCFYAGPAFRYERPQKGRQRQFHQVGAELLGASEPTADVEMIVLAAHTLRVLGLGDAVTLELNSLGDAESRAAYREALVVYLTQHEAGLSDDSKIRLAKNPLRILDSKNEGDRAIIAGAPLLTDYFNDHSKQFFAAVRAGLANLGIVFTLNAKLVRGLDYYSHTVFEFTTSQLGAQGTVLAGGRYDGLVGLMGGPEIAGMGFAAGVERLVGLREVLQVAQAGTQTPRVHVVPMGDSAENAAWELATQLRAAGIATEIAYKGKAGKRLERANKQGAEIALMLGDDELAANTVTLKHFKTGVQETIPRAELINTLRHSNESWNPSLQQ
ncbi:MAG: histidine--tRNA ligase [Rickettsiales bacterium]